MATDTASYVACRTLGHAWDWIAVPGSTPPPGGGNVWLWLRCTRCTTERHDQVGQNTGAVDRRQYVYPDGYSHAGEPAIPRDTWRREYLSLIQPRR